MTTATSRLGLLKPDYVDTADIDVINDNMDTIDLAVGVSIINTVSEITDPYNGQFAYELTNKQLRFFINGEWLLVAAGDLNSGNPDRIRLPPGSLNNLSDTTNAFQIGVDSSLNIAIDQNEIQARNNEAAAILYLNEQGGAVHVGPGSELIITSKGMNAVSMDSKEAYNGNNIAVGGTGGWNDGADVVSVDCDAPPSGKFLVLVSGRSNIDTASGNVEISYVAFPVGGGADVVTPGSDGNTITNASDTTNTNNQNNLTSTIADLVKGLTPGTTYRFKVQHRRDSGSTTGQIDFRKIIVIPQV